MGTGPDPHHPVDNGFALASDEVVLGPKGGAGPVDLPPRRPAGPGRYASTVSDPAAAASSPSGPVSLPRPVALALAVLGGVSLTLAFPGTDWWPLAPVGVGLLAVAARGASARAGALLGLVTGLAFFLPHLHWSGIYVGALPWVALSTLEAAFVALLGALLPAAWRVPGGRAGTVLAVGGLWVGQEALRGRVPFGGFPWGRLAFSQADSPALAWAAVGGASLLSFVVAAAGGALAVAAVAVLDNPSPRRRTPCPARAARTRRRARRPRGRPRRPDPDRRPADRPGRPPSRATSPRPGSTSTPSAAPSSTTTRTRPSTSRCGSGPAARRPRRSCSGRRTPATSTRCATRTRPR